ncbi:MAG: hypothetical protein CMN28_11555 [Salinisphaeraceae bacterium]|nr:hypothetical protein [Salinisphaeraceae bacterium]
MKSVFAAVLGAGLLVPAASAQAAPPESAVGLNVGTLGVGLAATFDVNRVLNARVLVAGLSIDPDIDYDGEDLEYEGEVDLFSMGALLDYHPFGGGLRLTAGLGHVNNSLEGSATCEETTCELGDSGSQVLLGDRVDADVEFKGTSPYVGIGWGNAVATDGRWTFSLDLGVYFVGSASADVTCSNVAVPANLAACQLAAQAEERELEDDLDNYELYPVLQLGTAYRF